MKTSKLLALSFLLFAFTTFSLPGAGADDPSPTPGVVDIFGHPVMSHSVYYIYGTPYGTNHTNLQVGIANESSCPHRLELSSISSKEQVVISPVVEIPDDFSIHVSTNVKFNFAVTPVDLCDSTEWRIYNDTDQLFVVTGCKDDDIHDWFQIVPFNGTTSNCPATYEIHYCPRPDPFCKCDCVKIGYTLIDGRLYLTPTKEGEAFPITFGKA